jgi:hypothetical protein
VGLDVLIDARGQVYSIGGVGGKCARRREWSEKYGAQGE